MARRNASKDTVETEATAPESTDTESQVEGTEQEGAQTEGAETEGTDKAKAEIDLTAFKEAVEAAVENSDPDMGSLPVVSVDSVSTEYRKLEGQKAKNAAKNWVEDGIRDAVAGENPSMRRARAFVEVRDALAVAVASKSSTPKEPVDPTIGYANRLASLQLALSIVGNDVPDGVDVEKANTQAGELVGSLTDDVEKYRTWLNAEGEDKGDKPEVSPVVVAAFKLATGKATGAVRSGGKSGGGSTYAGPKREVAKHITEYFADKEVGHFAKISEIAKFKSAEYGDDHPSQGAVTAHVFTKEGEPKTREGFEGVAPAGDQPKGIRKIA
jgi:hypothetical protein